MLSANHIRKYISILAILILSTWMLSWISGRQGDNGYVEDRDEMVSKRPPNLPSSEDMARMSKQRINFNTRRITAYAWPSEGGLLAKEVDGLDLLQLGVSRFQPTQRSEPFDQQAEDEWADTLRRIAPRWVHSPREMYPNDRPRTAIEQAQVFVLWPAGGNSGVWILRYPNGRVPMEFSVYDACLTLEERLEVMKRFGAEYYENPEDVFELSREYSKEGRRQRLELSGWRDETTGEEVADWDRC